MSEPPREPPPGRRVAYGDGWVLLLGMLAAASALFGMWSMGSRRSVRVAVGMILVYLVVRFAVAPAAAAFTRRLRRRSAG